jgi:hypothetical protein
LASIATTLATGEPDRAFNIARSIPMDAQRGSALRRRAATLILTSTFMSMAMSSLSARALRGLRLRKLRLRLAPR